MGSNAAPVGAVLLRSDGCPTIQRVWFMASSVLLVVCLGCGASAFAASSAASKISPAASATTSQQPSIPLSIPPSLSGIANGTGKSASVATLASSQKGAAPMLVGGTGVSSAPAAALDMQAAVDKAVRWHPLLRNARGQLLQITQSIETARAGYYPSVTAGVNAQTSNHPIGSSDSHQQHRAEVRVSQTVYDFGKVDSQVDQATAASGAARAQVLLVFDQVILNTAQAWVEVRRNQALARVAKEQVDAVKTLAELTGERQEKGAGTYSDTAQAQARVDAAQVELMTAQSQVGLWRTTLMHWVGSSYLPGVSGMPLAALRGACQASGVGSAQSLLSMQSMHAAASVQVAEAQLNAARAGLELAKAQLLPTLSVTGSAGRRLDIGANSADSQGPDASIMLNFSVPLYQGGLLRSGQRAAGYAVGAARAALDQARLTANQGLQNAVLQWRKFAGRIKVQKARQESMRITRVLYKQQYLQLGTRSLLDLLNAEQEYYGAISDQIESKHEMYQQELGCLYYKGQLRRAFGEQKVVSHALNVVDASDGGSTEPVGIRVGPVGSKVGGQDNGND